MDNTFGAWLNTPVRSGRLAVVKMPPSARGRKSRLLRTDEPPHDLLVVIRATPADREAAIDEMVEDAELSSRQYVVEAIPKAREVLYGVSVFARRPGDDVAAVIDRFTGAPAFIEITIGALRASDFEALPTGANVDHFDIQLIAGIREQDPPAKTDSLRQAAARVLAAGGPLRPNPAYAGGTAESPREDR
ncbi:MAG TPA: hypothetical protein VM142_16240 [Acidimicrobiales bacterium]|nr:hypothetical protein [Acidimicrobiales bacterium]